MPGAGLALMRAVGGIAEIVHGLNRFNGEPAFGAVALGVIEIASGLLLMAGLWTPLAGTAVAVLGAWNLIARHEDPWANVLLGTMGLALTLIGPGAWSIDSRLFGWRRIDVRQRSR